MTLKEFIKACIDEGVDMNDEIRIRVFESDYEIIYEHGTEIGCLFIDK